jgi:CDP-diacylglycerol--glycerol-3-phosphate 3-phosphatidyltransferase
VSVWNVANVLTGLRLAAVPLFAWLLLHQGGDSAPWRLAAFVVFVAASLTDQIDGMLARRYGLITDVGKVADPIADKALMGTAMVVLSILGELAWWVTVVVVFREVAVTLLRLAVLRRAVVPASRGGKAKTAAQAIAIGLYLWPWTGLVHPLAVAVMAVAVVLTVVSGLDYAVRIARLFR